MLHRRDGARFPPDVTLGIQAKEFNLGFIRPENLVSHGLRVFCSDMRCQLWDLIQTGVGLSKLCHQLDLSQVNSNEVVEISRMINGNRMHLHSISSLIAVVLNVYVNKVFLFKKMYKMYKFINLFSLCHYGVLCVD